jgi:hypothetical protein
LLQTYFNLLALDGLPPRSFSDIKNAGYDGVQFAVDPTPEELQDARRLQIAIAGSGRINDPEKTKPLAERWAGDGFVCSTLHVGWGLEDDTEAPRLIESVLTASVTYKIPLYFETHRATILQDMWRSVRFVERFPEMRFNGDFSHWYTGQEMVYGGFASKFDYIRPVIERVRFVHGRIGNPGCMQVALTPGDPEPEYVGHFRRLWTECFRHGAEIFTPELLAPGIYYARTFRDAAGVEREESDRWQQSLLLRNIAHECYREAHTHA